MIKFPFVDLIEEAIKWCKEHGSRLYWTWVSVIGVGGYVLGGILTYLNTFEMLQAVLIWATVLVITGIPVWIYETQVWGKKNKKQEHKDDGGR